MNTKLMVALVIVGVLAVAVVGMVAAQIATPTPNGTTNTSPVNGLFGWIGRCFGLRAQQYSGTQTAASQEKPVTVTVTDPNTNTTTTYKEYPGYGAPFSPSQPENITVTDPNTGTTTTYQGYNGFGPCGGMMNRFFP